VRFPIVTYILEKISMSRKVKGGVFFFFKKRGGYDIFYARLSKNLLIISI
jgi:hypothetical protein